MKKVLVTIYIHPEYYPPTLYAIGEFSHLADEVIVVTRNQVSDSQWRFSENVKVKASGNHITLEESMQMSLIKKIMSYCFYIKTLYSAIKSLQPALVVAYDPIALFSVWLVHRMLCKRSYIFWYHNHDVLIREKLKRFSVGWLAAQFEKSCFKIIDIFTLPSEERKKYFPIGIIRDKYYFIPNFPSLAFYKPFYIKKLPFRNEIRLLYQGKIANGHGLEQIIRLLNTKINGMALSLTLLGPSNDAYKQYLIRLSENTNTRNKLWLLPTVSYAEMPLITRHYDIGIAIHQNQDVQYSTAATASNKIYEYPALGLPVILFDNEHYRLHLGKFKWAFFTDVSTSSLINCIEAIIQNYAQISEQAHLDFINTLHYEKNFAKIIEKEIVNCKS